MFIPTIATLKMLKSQLAMFTHMRHDVTYEGCLLYHTLTYSHCCDSLMTKHHHDYHMH